MKNRLLALIILSCLAFSSCNDEPELPTIDTERFLVGTWVLSGLAYDGVSTVTDADGNITETKFTGDAEEIDISLIIETDPNVYTSAGSYVVSVTSELFGQQVDQNLVFSNFLGDGTWEEDDRVFITNDANNGERRETDILELTEESLILDFLATNSILVQDMQVEQVIEGAAIFRK